VLDLLLDGLFQAAGWLHGRRRPRWHRDVRRAGYFPAHADEVGVFAVDSEGRVWFAPHPADWSNPEPVHARELIDAALAQAGRWSRRARAFVPDRAPGER